MFFFFFFAETAYRSRNLIRKKEPPLSLINSTMLSNKVKVLRTAGRGIWGLSTLQTYFCISNDARAPAVLQTKLKVIPAAAQRQKNQWRSEIYRLPPLPITGPHFPPAHSLYADLSCLPHSADENRVHLSRCVTSTKTGKFSL